MKAMQIRKEICAICFKKGRNWVPINEGKHICRTCDSVFDKLQLLSSMIRDIQKMKRDCPGCIPVSVPRFYNKVNFCLCKKMEMEEERCNENRKILNQYIEELSERMEKDDSVVSIFSATTGKTSNS